MFCNLGYKNMGYKNTYTLREREKKRGLQKQRDRSVTKTKRERKKEGGKESYKNKGTPLGYKNKERLFRSPVTKAVTKTQTSYPRSRKNRTADSIPNTST